MTNELKKQLLQAIEQAPESVLKEALHYIQYLTDRHFELQEDLQDLEDSRAALKEAETEGTVSWEELKTELGL